MKQKVTARVLSQKEMAPGIYDMWIETALAKEAKPGQFICVYPKDKSTLLPRPISICEKAENGEKTTKYVNNEVTKDKQTGIYYVKNTIKI